jgi:hypothetical protein
MAMNLKHGGMFKLKRATKHASTVIFGYEWVGSPRACAEDYLRERKNFWDGTGNLGRRVCVDTQEIFMLMDWFRSKGIFAIIVKAWTKVGIVFLEFNEYDHTLIEVTSAPEKKEQEEGNIVNDDVQVE